VALADLGIARDQPSETMRRARAALELSSRLGEWPQRAQALTHAGDAERLGGNLASARGYFEEAVHARVLSGQPCDAHAIALTMPELLYRRPGWGRARGLGAAAPACDRPPRAVEVVTLTRLLRSGHGVGDRTSLLAQIERARSATQLAGDRTLFDFL